MLDNAIVNQQNLHFINDQAVKAINKRHANTECAGQLRIPIEGENGGR